MLNKNVSNYFTISSRIKAQDSISYKIYKYTKHKEEGKVPIIKCLNDIFGIRIIHKAQFEISKITEFAKLKKIKLKCIDASKGDYRTIHIYFKNENSDFCWELQIWKEEDKKSNMESHEKYKQEYVKWIEQGGEHKWLGTS